jgi:hypothetical protein
VIKFCRDRNYFHLLDPLGYMIVDAEAAADISKQKKMSSIQCDICACKCVTFLYPVAYYDEQLTYSYIKQKLTAFQFLYFISQIGASLIAARIFLVRNITDI